MAQKTKTVKQTKTKQLINYVAIVLDKSGSMESIRKEAVDAFNQQVDTIRKESKKQNQKSYVSLVTFNTEVDSPVIWCEDSQKLDKLDQGKYSPNGLTSMFDAVGTTIEKLKERSDINDPNVSVLMIVISDGFENNSKKYNGNQIAELVKQCQDTKRWSFVYLGANQDLSQVSKQLNIPINNTLSFMSTSAGTIDASNTTSVGTTNYFSMRGAGSTYTTDFYSGNDGSNTDISSNKKKKKT